MKSIPYSLCLWLELSLNEGSETIFFKNRSWSSHTCSRNCSVYVRGIKGPSIKDVRMKLAKNWPPGPSGHTIIFKKFSWLRTFFWIIFQVDANSNKAKTKPMPQHYFHQNYAQAIDLGGNPVYSTLLQLFLTFVV